jgi:flagellar basal-body rod protein FlgG
MNVLSGFGVVPPDTVGVNVAPDGNVTIVTPGGNDNFRVTLTRFNNPAGLEPIGGNLFRPTEASGAAENGNPSEDGYGELAQGYLELSNVKVVEEMVNLIIAQRAYEVNSKAVHAADEMLQQSNNLKR